MKKIGICLAIVCLLSLFACSEDGVAKQEETTAGIVTSVTGSADTPGGTQASTKQETLSGAVTTVPEETTEFEGTTVSPETTAPMETTAPEETTVPGGILSPGETEEESVFYEAEFVLGSISGMKGEFFDSNTRFATVDYIPLDEIEAVTVGKGFRLTWFAYDSDFEYLGNGSNCPPALPEGGVWHKDGEGVLTEQIMTWCSEAYYLKFAVRKTDGSAIFLETDVEASEAKIYISGYQPKEVIYESFYDGEGLGADGMVSIRQVGAVHSGVQDGAAYGGYLFSLNGSGCCRVYALDGTFTYVSEFMLDQKDMALPHSNSVCFGTEKYNAMDEFPLLYCNIYNNYGIQQTEWYGTCNVYRVLRDGNQFSSQLVQIIRIDFTHDTEQWASPGGDVRPYGNFVIDPENQKLIAYTMRDESMTTRFFVFDLPKWDDGTIFDGNPLVGYYPLRLCDVVASFDTEYSYYVQGGTYADGKLWSLEGFTDHAKNRPALKVVSLSEQRLVATVDLYEMGLTTEPEAVYEVNGTLYYIVVTGEVYEVTFH